MRVLKVLGLLVLLTVPVGQVIPAIEAQAFPVSYTHLTLPTIYSV